MEIRNLATFQAVARFLSFNRAALELNYAQSSVSAQIQALEDELGVQLFDRLGRRILLTEAGSKLLQYAEKMLDLADETRAEVAGAKELKGSLTIKVPETIGVHRLPKVIKEFKSGFPKSGCDSHRAATRDSRRIFAPEQPIWHSCWPNPSVQPTCHAWPWGSSHCCWSHTPATCWRLSPWLMPAI